MITNSLTLWKLTIVLWYGLSICQNKHCLTWHFDLTNDQCLTVIISSGVLYIITIVKVEDSDLKCHSLTNTWKQAVIAYTLLVITVCHELYKLYSCHYWILLLTCTYMYCYFVSNIKSTAPPIISIILMHALWEKTVLCHPRSNSNPFDDGEIVLYNYGTRVVVSWRDTALSSGLCCYQPLGHVPHATNLVNRSSLRLSNT